MTVIDINTLYKQLNRCYLDYDPDHSSRPSIDQHRVAAFKYYVEDIAGLTLDYEIVEDGYGGFRYIVNKADVADEEKYLMFILRWS